MNANDTTHVSVITVDNLAEEGSPKQTITKDKGTPTSPVSDQAITPPSKSLGHSESDQGYLETSSNISNMSNLSAGSPSTGRSVSSAEEETRPTMSLIIEGTTVGATDVDDDVFDHSAQNDAKVRDSIEYE